MPPITIVKHESDGEGGWFVHWHDEANLDGQPLDAFMHITPEKVDALEHERRLKGAPPTKMQEARETLRQDRERVKGGGRVNIPEGVVPYAARDFIEGYNQHVKDSIDRINLRVPANAPHEALERARENRNAFGAEEKTPFEQFADKQAAAHRASQTPTPDPMTQRRMKALQQSQETDESGGSDDNPKQRVDGPSS